MRNNGWVTAWHDVGLTMVNIEMCMAFNLANGGGGVTGATHRLVLASAMVERTEDARQQLGGLHAARSQQTKMLEEHESEIRELNDTLYRARMEHDADTVRVQQQQQQLAAQVRAYHQDLLDTMRQVSAAQAQDSRQTAAA